MRKTEERTLKKLKTEEFLENEIINRMKGITLIALVITIVVLLILAGITISTLTGENGILAKASAANENTIIGNEKEAIKVSYNGAKVNNLGQTVTASELKSELDRNGYKETTVIGATTLRIKFEETGHIYTIKTDGEIAMSLPGDKDPDKKIVEILGEDVALTESGKVVIIGTKTTEGESTQNDWQELEVLEEIPEINGVYKKYINSSSYYIIDNNGDLYAWGYNDVGQLGIGDTENKSTPVLINDFIDNKKVESFEFLFEEFYIVTEDGACYLHTYIGK